MKKNIVAKRDGVTREYQPQDTRTQVFSFPSLGVSVTAATYAEALEAAKVKHKANLGQVATN